MIIIGEKINATRKKVGAAIEAKDRDHIVELAMQQVEAGASYLDVNGGHPTREIEVLEWLVDIVQDTTDTPICLDSSNKEAIIAGLKKVKAKPLINSISLEKERLEQYLPIIRDHDCGVIALLMSDDGVPSSLEDRKSRADKLISTLVSDAKKNPSDIYVDPCFLAIYTEEDAGLPLLETISYIKEKWPEVHVTGGLSNASYGLPKRKWINQAFLTIAMSRGMDSVIIDPCVEGTMPLVLAAEVVLGLDEMGMTYTQAGRAEKL